MIYNHMHSWSYWLCVLILVVCVVFPLLLLVIKVGNLVLEGSAGFKCS